MPKGVPSIVSHTGDIIVARWKWNMAMFIVLQFGRYAIGYVLGCGIKLVHVLQFFFLLFLSLEPTFGGKRSVGLSAAELKRMQRICLELYCQYDSSILFRELEPSTNTAYYEIIQTWVSYFHYLFSYSKMIINDAFPHIHRPITLDMIRAKLVPSNQAKYNDVASFIDDVILMINNVYLFYRVS